MKTIGKKLKNVNIEKERMDRLVVSSFIMKGLD